VLCGLGTGRYSPGSFSLSRIATIDDVLSGRSLPFEKMQPVTVGQVTDSLAGEEKRVGSRHCPIIFNYSKESFFANA
jgi:hypothetical protein